MTNYLCPLILCQCHILLLLFSFQLFDQAAVAEIVLHNTGKVGLNFLVLNVDSGNKPLPGAPNVFPIQGHIRALSQQTLTIRYLPGVPEKFEKTFQVSCFYRIAGEICITCLTTALLKRQPRYHDQFQGSIYE